MRLVKMLFVLSVIMFGTVTAGFAMDCIGGKWVDGPNCAQMGLDTHAGVCRPGDIFETRCDDRRGSRGQTQHIICSGSQRCPVMCKEDGYRCDYDSDCCSNDCYRGVCGRPVSQCQEEGYRCYYNSDCCSYNCDYGVCRY